MTQVASLLRLLGALGLLSMSTASMAQAVGVSLSEVFHGFLVGHLERFRDSAPDARYQVGSYDLNGDNRLEMLVYLRDPIWCGPHGCDLLIFTPSGRGQWRQVAEIGAGATPVHVLEGRTRGWRDLSLYVSTSLMPGERRRFSYDGATYSDSPRPLRREVGRPLITRQSAGHDLFKPWPTRSR
jgi:hypothetical protein